MRNFTILSMTAAFAMMAGTTFTSQVNAATRADDATASVNYTIEPKAGSVVDAINTVTVTFEGRVGYTEVRPGNGVLENTTTGSVFYCYTPFLQGYDNDGNSIYSLSFYELGVEEPSTVNEIGEYTLSIRGFYTNANPDPEGEEEPEYLPVIVVNYSIEYPVSYTLDPEDGSVVDDLSTINITFGEKVAFNDEVRPAVATLENTTSGALYYCYNPMMDRMNTDGTNFAFELSFYELGAEEPATITEAGEYVLSIRGAYNDVTTDEDGDELPEYLPVIVAHYTIEYPVVYEFDPAAGSDVEDLNTVTLTFPNDALVGIDSEVRPAAVMLENLTTGDTWVCENPLKSYTEDGGAVFTITFSELGSSETVEITEVGTYLLTVKGLFTSVLDGDDQTDTELPNITALFYISDSSAVRSLFNASETSFNVYGLNGVQMLRNANADQLSSLRPGLYIINGKKVLVR